MNTIGPSVCFKIQKIIGVSIGEGNLRNYHVQWAPSWVSGFHLVGCENLIEEFSKQEAERDNRTGWNNNNEQEQHNNTVTVSSPYRQFKEEETVIVKPLSPPHIDTHNTDSKNPNFEWMKKESNTTQRHQYKDNSNENDEGSESDIISPLGYSESFIDDPPRGATCEQRNFIDIREDGDNEVMILDESGDSIEIGSSSFNEQHHDFEEHNESNDYTYKIVLPSESAHSDNSSTNTQLQQDFQCPVCHLQLPNRSSYYKHKQTHKDIQKTFTCRVCGEVFPNATEMRQHRSVHRERRHKCDYCDKSFFTSTKLRNHTRVHTDERPYSCEVCGKGFKRMDHLREHARTHARGGGGGRGCGGGEGSEGGGESSGMGGDVMPVIDVSNMSVM